MNARLDKLLDPFRRRIPEVPGHLARAIEALWEAQGSLESGDIETCSRQLDIAQAALEEDEKVEPGTATADTDEPGSGEAAIRERAKHLSAVCRKALRDLGADQPSLRPARWVIVSFCSIAVILAALVAVPYLAADRKIAMARTQVYWVRDPQGLGETWSRFSPIALDGQWHEIELTMREPMTAIRIDPANNATVLEYYDVRNARVEREDPRFAADPELPLQYWRGFNCVATPEVEYLRITEPGPDCNVLSQSFPSHDISAIRFEARAESRRLPVWTWMTWTLGWRSINE